MFELLKVKKEQGIPKLSISSVSSIFKFLMKHIESTCES